VTQLTLSYSAISTWRECRKKYAYAYVEKLRPKFKGPQLSLGEILHEYLELYYKRLQGAMHPRAAHAASLADIEAKWRSELELARDAAYALSDVELGDTYGAMWDEIVRIASRYFVVRGHADASSFAVLLVEEPFSYPLIPGVNTVGTIDLVTRDRDGNIALWEHKTVRSIPRTMRRLRDLQTTLYKAVAEQVFSETVPRVDLVIWNYLRTKPPSVPEQLKTGELSRRKNLDTTWAVYYEEILKLGLDPEDYEDMRVLLEGREERMFYPRMAVPIVSDEGILLRDFITSAREIVTALPELAHSDPVRSIGTHCDYCPYARLCEAVITGGEVAPLERQLFTRKESNRYERRTDDEEDFAALFT
jgi:hypothetical protein